MAAYNASIFQMGTIDTFIQQSKTALAAEIKKEIEEAAAEKSAISK